MTELDSSYWKVSLAHPYSPNDEDLDVYKNNMTQGTTLLLGCTHILLPFSNQQLDIDPWYTAPSVIHGDWRDNTLFFDNMIGDGPLNFSKELADSVVFMAQKYCRNLILRSFNYKLPLMKIANYFPEEKDFLIPPAITIKKQEYSFFIWKLDHD